MSRISSIIGIIIAVGIVGLLVALVAIILYKRHLNRVVSGKEHDLHTRTVEPGTVLRSVLICLMNVNILLLMVMNIQLKLSLADVKDTLYDQGDRLREINYKLNALDELDELVALTRDYQFSFKNFDPKSKTVEMELDVLLKEFSENTSASVRFDDTVAQLQNKGDGSFSGSIPVELFKNYESYPVLYLETEGLIKTQELNKCPIGCIAEYLLPSPSIFASRIEIKYDKNGNLLISGNMEVNKIEKEMIDGYTLESASIAFELDGEIVKEIPLQFVDRKTDIVDISATIPAKKDQPFTICLKSVTGAGWTVTEMFAYYDWKEGYGIYGNGDFSVTDENGALLYSRRLSID